MFLAGTLCAALAALGMAASPAVHLDVFPTRIVLQHEHSTGAITLTNTGATPVLMHLTAWKWSETSVPGRLPRQNLQPTDRLLAVPPIFSLPPGASQTVRVGLLDQTPTTREDTYRVLVTQVPTHQAGSWTTLIAVQISLPIFVLPNAVDAAPHLQWSATQTDAQHVRLQVTNVGLVHADLGLLKLFADPARHTLLAQSPVSTYLLAGQSATLSVALARPVHRPTLLYVEADSLEGPALAAVPLHQP
jgi:fimbrial chaperone protein